MLEWRDFLFEKSNLGEFVLQTAVSRDVWDRYPAYSGISYRNALIKPKFEVTDNVISVLLPVLNSQYQVTSDERKIINELGAGWSIVQQ